MKPKPLYIETFIRRPMEEVWDATQRPEIHEQWDLRFSEISYLPKDSPNAPQQFLYATRIAFGLKISGTGESVGTKTKGDGESTSVLKFWSAHPLSIIGEGSGYWKYVPKEGGTQFYTGYDYTPRFGWAGAVFDKFVFRPLLGWATAWSFDSLRLWLEKGLHPATARRLFLLHWTVRIALIGVWLYQGLVPKLLFQDSGEAAILRGSDLFPDWEKEILIGLGILEILFGLCFLLFRNTDKLHYVNIAAMLVLGLGAAFSQPLVLVAPFNPVSLNAALIGLSLVGLLLPKEYPHAHHCLRKKTRA